MTSNDKGTPRDAAKGQQDMTETAKSVAFIGIGKMGLPMSILVAKAGYAVTAFDQRATRLNEARAQGMAVANSAADAVNGCPAVISSLPNDAALQAVMLGTTGLIAAMAPKSILIETSTVSAEASAEVNAAAQARGVAYLRAPVSGNASIVHTGALSCFVSGPRDAFEGVKPLFASFTRAQTYLGSSEEARYAKLAVNLMIAVSAAMMAESLALARKGGIAWQDILNVLDDSAVASPMVKYKTAPLRTRDFEFDLLLQADGEGPRPHPRCRPCHRRTAAACRAGARNLRRAGRAGRRRDRLHRHRQAP